MNHLNWKSEEDYAFTVSLTNVGWAWEFLRRSPQYREDWIAANDQHELFSAHQANSKFSTHRNPFVIFDPPVPDGVKSDDWAFKENVDFFSPLRGYGRKWGLKDQIQNPLSSAPPAFDQIYSVMLLDWEELGRYYTPVAEDLDILRQAGRIAVVGIDLSRTLTAIKTDIVKLVKEQNTLRQVNKAEQKHFEKKENWQLFLRILDAQNSGASQTDMGRILLTHIEDYDVANTTISQYIDLHIPELTNPETIIRLANEPT